MPIVIAPTGSAGLAWHEGEIALARAAKAAGIPFTLATGSMTAIERVAAEAGGKLWFQLYMWPDRSLSHGLMDRAKAAGYEALVVTVDTPVPPGREYNLRNGMTVPFRFTRRNVTDVMMHPRWLTGVLLRYLLTTGMPRYENYPTEMKARITALPMGRSMAVTDSLTWDDLRELRRLWPHALMVKGILRAEDARLAADCGADGVIVSNHGGRAVDSTRAPIEILPEVVDAVGNRITVLVDSGFRRGADVIKALALGAKAVLIGRATLYGTAVAGEAGRRARDRNLPRRDRPPDGADRLPGPRCARRGLPRALSLSGRLGRIAQRHGQRGRVDLAELQQARFDSRCRAVVQFREFADGFS